MRAWAGQDEYVSGRFHANSALFNQLPLHLVHGDYQPYQNLESVISVLLSLQQLIFGFWVKYFVHKHEWFKRFKEHLV